MGKMGKAPAYRPGEMIYEGKAKKVHLTDDPGVVWVDYKDDATAFNGVKRGTIKGKGYFNNQISAIFFQLLKEAGIETHFIAMDGDRSMFVKKLKILPIEVVVRNVVAGSLAKRTGLPEGTMLPSTVLELYYKNDALGDPLFNDEHVAAMGLATPEQVSHIKSEALRVNRALRAFLVPRKLDLIDFKLEFGLHDGKVLLGDEISPDTCRFWDTDTKEKLDKDRFRRDLGNVEEAYAEVLHRVSQPAAGDVFGTGGVAAAAAEPQVAAARAGGNGAAANGGGRWQARVFVTLKRTVLDPQGRTVQGALEVMGYRGVGDVRVGKYMEIAVDAATEGEARSKVDDMCRRLLSNPVIEEYSFEVAAR